MNKVVIKYRFRLLDNGLEDIHRSQEWVLAEVFDDLHDSLSLVFGFVEEITLSPTLELEKDQFLSKTIRFGGKGLGPFMKLLYDVHCALMRVWDDYNTWGAAADCSQIVNAVDILNIFGDLLHRIVLEYRQRFPRHLLDPPGFAELHDAVRTGIGSFEVSRHIMLSDSLLHDTFQIAPKERFKNILGYDVFKSQDFDISDARIALVADFGSVDIQSEMRPGCLTFGEHGIPAFIDMVIIPLLDHVPLESVQYDPLMNLFRVFCAELAQKIVSTKKVTPFISM